MSKNILITGKNSYIGNQLEEWLTETSEPYNVMKISVRDDKWADFDFSTFDTVVHVAGVAHIKETEKNQNVYYQVNRDLATAVAQKAKLEGVKHFIFLSTMSVYGIEQGIIDENTPLKPQNAYGKSKLEAEEKIAKLQDTIFKVTIIRPPMVYGKESKGNYTRLAKLAVRSPVFPEINNKRSMIYIDNLSECIRSIISTSKQGVVLPQNKDYVNTTELVKLIAKAHGKKIFLIKGFNSLIKLWNNTVINKVFGSLIYAPSVTTTIDLVDFEESIEKTEKS